MGNFFRILGFSLALILTFTLVANLLPQVEGESPQNETELDLNSMDMASFVGLGETVFRNKGTCTLCHNTMGRAPNLLELDLVKTAKKRLADQRYKGDAVDAESYIRESMLNPGIYVVAGFGVKGSNDTKSPMPNVSKAPIQLNEIEIDAVIAFLQGKDGNEITVVLPKEDNSGNDESSAPQVQEQTSASTPMEILENYSCTGCHAIGNGQADIGPDLHTVGNRLSTDEIRQSILFPTAKIAEGFEPYMPDGIADEMLVRELEVLVEYLAAQKGFVEDKTELDSLKSDRDIYETREPSE